MKIFAGLAVAACLMVSSASAATFYAVGLCETAGGVFGFNNPNPNSPPISGSWTCPTAASLGITQLVTSEFVVYDGDYSSGLNTPVTEITNFSLAALGGASFAFGTDTITTTGTASSASITCISGTFNQSTNLPPGLLAGCYDNATSGTLGGGATVLYTNTFTAGTALQGTGYAEIAYDYSVTTGSPEPVSMLLLGGGLLSLSIIGRKKFSRK